MTLIGACSIMELTRAGFRSRSGHLGHVAGKLHDLDQPPELSAIGLYEAWMTTSLPPLPIRAILARQVLAAVEPGPEFAVFRRVLQAVLDEHAVMPAFDFVQRIAERVRKLSLASDIVPSIWNSMTACDLPMAASRSASSTNSDRGKL